MLIIYDMQIVHYTLGFPSHRSGGLVKYALDLAEQEKKLGHQITIIYPGNIYFIGSSICKLVKEKEKNGFVVYKLANALPIPLLYGTKFPQDFIKQRHIADFDRFINDCKPDIFHVHTLMGLPIELIKGMKDAGVKIVYTSHDYFGLCPRVNFVNDRGCVCVSASPYKCALCCSDSKSTLFLKLRNSKFVVPLKKMLR